MLFRSTHALLWFNIVCEWTRREIKTTLLHTCTRVYCVHHSSPYGDKLCSCIIHVHAPSCMASVPPPPTEHPFVLNALQALCRNYQACSLRSLPSSTLPSNASLLTSYSILRNTIHTNTHIHRAFVVSCEQGLPRCAHRHRCPHSMGVAVQSARVPNQY